MSGLDIRRYRKRIGWNQTRFAERLGVSQSALSLIESGRVAVSEDHITKLRQAFAGSQTRPAFRDFLRDLDRGRAEGQAALTTSRGRYLMLPVWRWESGFDLSSALAPEHAVDMVTVRATKDPTIAFAMTKASEHWTQGEILVFERCRRTDLEDGDVCLLQVRLPRAKRNKTTLAVAHVVPDKGGQTVQFEPISPAGPIFSTKDDALPALLRVVYRGRHLK